MAEPTPQPPSQPPPPPEGGPPEPNYEGPPERFDVGNLHAPIMRENLEPRDGFEPVPIWLVAIFGAFLFWGGWYIATYSGGWRADVLESQPQARFLVPPEVGDRPVDPITLGRQLYRQHCVACHQADGQGVPGTYPALAGSDFVVGQPARLKRIVLHGMEGPAVVMPGFSRQNDQQISAILTYIRQEWGNEASPISAVSVAATREATEGRRTPWTESELLQIMEDDLPEGAPGEALEGEVPDGPEPEAPEE